MSLRILASSDLHYNVDRSKGPTRQLAKQVIARGGDVLALAGDIAGADPEDFEAALELFDRFEGVKLLVPGNHDLWVAHGQNSYTKWSRQLPHLARRHGFCMLDHGQVQVGAVGFVGNVGWYDYSFRSADLAVPLRFYQAKVGPGRAAAVAKFRQLVEDNHGLEDRHHQITIAWRDGQFVNLPVSDTEFTDQLVRRLDRQLTRSVNAAEKIVAVLHHLPRRELVQYRGDGDWDFAAAFLGSERFGQVLGQYDQVKLCLSGHSHRADFINGAACRYVSIGSTYTAKALMEFHL